MGDTLTVSECFGPTVQGEGPHAGQRCGFLRLGLCNLNCAWCDTSYTWDWEGQNGIAYDREEELHTLGFGEVLAAIERMGVDRIVLTGGEPLVQTAKLARFLPMVPAAIHIDVETNGTLSPVPLAGEVDHWSVSPKLANSGVRQDAAWKFDVLSEFVELEKGEYGSSVSVAFKFVCTGPEDFMEIEMLQTAADIPDRLIWIMPEGKTSEEIAEHRAVLAEDAITRGWNLTGRMHVDIWGARRGV